MNIDLIGQARLDLAKWEARVTEDEAALATIVRQAAEVNGRLADAVRCANSLRSAIQRWEEVHMEADEHADLVERHSNPAA